LRDVITKVDERGRKEKYEAMVGQMIAGRHCLKPDIGLRESDINDCDDGAQK